jgi:hypothetical protein
LGRFFGSGKAICFFCEEEGMKGFIKMNRSATIADEIIIIYVYTIIIYIIIYIYMNEQLQALNIVSPGIYMEVSLLKWWYPKSSKNKHI